MLRSLLERYAVGAFAFVAACTWAGVGIERGLICLAVSVAGFQAMRLYQLRSAAQSRKPKRSRRAEDRELPARVHDADERDGWLAVGDAAW